MLHRPGALCRALVDPLLPDGDRLELAGGYNGLSWLVGRGNELINPQGGFNVTSTSGGESTQQLPEPPGGGPGGSDNEEASWIQDNCQQLPQEEWQSSLDQGGGGPPGRNQALYEFTTRTGAPVKPENLIKRDFKPLLKDAGLPEIRFHDLRHTCATLLLGRGVHPKIVQELLGHRTITMTLDNYSHYLPAMGDQVSGAMGDALG